MIKFKFGKPLCRSIIAVAIMMLSLQAMAYDFSYTHQGKTLYYNITSENTVAVTYYSSVSDSNNYVNGDVVIPSSVEYNGSTYSVTSIDSWAFDCCYSLTSVSIPNSVTAIGTGAFCLCGFISSINIPEGITSLENYTFYACMSLTDIVIPNTVNTIGKYAFAYCEDLASIQLPSSLTELDTCAFYHCKSLNAISFPNGLTRIGAWAFDSCVNLSSITLPESLTTIEKSAFRECNGLQSAELPSSLAVLDTAVFEYCTSLTSVNLPNGLTRIGAWAFDSCVNLSSITLPESLTTIEKSAFRYSGLTSVTIPDNVTKIDYFAFYGCNALTEATVGESVQVLNYGVFQNCTSLTSVNLPNGLTTIDMKAFSGCSRLSSITIPTGVTSIGESAFENCSSLTTLNFNAVNCQDFNYSSRPFIDTPLTTVNIGDSVQRIPANFVLGCSDLTSITIPSSVTSIGNDAFSYCSGLTTLNFNAINCQDFYDNDHYPYSPFSGTSLTTVNIGDGVQRIPANFVLGHSDLTSITIPSSVTSIGDGAFSVCSSLTTLNFNAINCQDFYDNVYYPYYPFSDAPLTTVNIGDSVQLIPANFVSGCSDLTSVTIPNSVTSIGNDAFSGCSGLTSVTIPNSVTSIGNAFSYCSGLTSINVASGNTHYSSIDGVLYNYVQDTLIQCPAAKTSVTIPNSVTSIGYGAFSGCSGLTSVTIGTGVTSIGSSVFYGCSGLTTLNFNAINCQDFAYYNYNESRWCYYSPFISIPLTTVNIGDSVQQIPANFVNGCNGLTSVTIPNSVTSIGYWAFNGCSGLTSVTIGNSVTSIGYEAFNGCSGLTSITIGNSVTSIGGSAFYGCSGLTTLNFNAINCQDFDGYTFGTSLTTVNIGDSVQQIPAYFVRGCSGLASVTIPNSVTSIGNDAFSGCSGLTSVTIPNSVTSIGKSAFYDCSGLTTLNFNAINCQDFDGYTFGTSLTTVNIGDSVQQIPAYFVNGCTELNSIIIPNNVTTIGRNAFNSCTGLTSVDLSEGLTSIGSYAFQNCSGLTSVTIPNSVTYIGEGAFRDCSGLTSVTIPNSVTSIEDWAFSGCSSLTSVTIPNSVTSIGSSAFYNCSGLTTLNFNAINCQDFYYSGDSYPFLGTSLTTVNIGDSVQRIPANFARNRGELTSIEFPVNIHTIGARAFDGCKSLTSITIPEMVDTIYSEAFANCDSLTTLNFNAINCFCDDFPFCENLSAVNIGSNVQRIPDNFLYGCTELDSIIIPSSITTIGRNAFNSCTGLTSVGLSEGLTSIGSYAFQGCSGLTVLTIPSTVTSIGSGAYYNGFYFDDGGVFAGCSGLTSITIPNGVTSIEPNTFYGCTGLASIVLPEGLVSIGDGAFANCSSLSALTIPSTVSSIGSEATGTGAFSGCTGLSSITSMAYYPPILSNVNTFPFAAIRNIPVHIPCGSSMHYRYAAYWNSFINIQDAMLYQLDLLVNDTTWGSATYSCVQFGTSLTAIPKNGATFVRWNDGNTENPRTVTITTDTMFTAIFGGHATYTVSVEPNNPAMGSVTGGGTFDDGSTTTISATPFTGYHFVSWSDGNADNPRTVTVESNITYTAVFAPNIYSVTAEVQNPSMGSVNGGGSYNYNSNVTLTAMPNSCSRFVSWTDGNTENPRTITVISDTTLTAVFEGVDYAGSITAAICEGSTYAWNGSDISEAGTYTQTLQAVNGCDSTVTLTLTINPVASTTLSAMICEGSVYTENGFNVSEAGTYTQNLQTINGCDSIVTLSLTVNPVENTNLSAAICEGSVYTENGFNVSEAGTYTQNLQTVNGCDSIVTLNLTISNVVNNDITAAICEGSVYTENGFNVSEAGTYTQNLQTTNGCDSIVTLTLTVNPVASTTFTAAICEGTTYTENGFNVSEAGTHTLNLQTINGCDSIVTLTLTVNPVANTNLTAAICEGSSYTENGFNESETGTYTQNLQTVNGCDSIVTLNLTVSTVINNDITAAICEGSVYTENGFNVSEAGTYTQNLQSVNGCDSVVTLTLTVNPTYNITIDASINEGETYEENGFSESEAGTYVHTFQAENGCDSVITLNLTVNSSLNDVVANIIEVSLYPNPAQSFVNMELSGEASETMVQLFDIQGKILRTYTLENGKKTLRIELDGLPAACYYLHIISDNRVVVKKIIKNN